MADHSHIEWTDATWNPVTGCSVVSPGCTNCYAMKLAGTRLKHIPSRAGLTRDSKAGPVWTGEVRFNEQWLDQPLRWKKPRMIFVCAHGDLFHEDVPDEWIDRVFAVMALSPRHTFQVLTKRAERMRAYISGFDCDGARRLNVAYGDNAHDEVANAIWPLPNVWLGVSAEDQQRASERIPDLLTTPAAIRFVSGEPLLGPIDLRRLRVVDTSASAGFPMADALGGEFYLDPAQEAPHIRALIELGRNTPPESGGIGLDWVIVGGESGQDARPMHPDWARSIRDQCSAAGVPFFFKQWGSFRPLTKVERGQACGATYVGPDRYNADSCMMKVSKSAAGRHLDGREHNGKPQRREVPFQ
jgi:protein gp37